MPERPKGPGLGPGGLVPAWVQIPSPAGGVMRFTIVSDLHGELVKLKGVVLNAGDMVPYDAYGKKAEEIYRKLFSLVDGEMFFVMGNVDKEEAGKVATEFPNVHLLDNEVVDINGVRVFGLNLSRYDPRENFDILLTHYPPYGYCDTNRYGQHIGEPFVLDLIRKYRPKVCVCGHVHGAAGTCRFEDTLLINTAKKVQEIEL